MDFTIDLESTRGRAVRDEFTYICRDIDMSSSQFETVRTEPFVVSHAELMAELGTQENGLNAESVLQKRKLYGANVLPMAPPTPPWRRFILQFHNVLIYILLFSALISLALGHILDSTVIFSVILINALVGYIQEGKAEAALRAILSMTRTECLVVREGAMLTLDSEELVPGDVVMLQAGNKVPADIRLFYCKDLHFDEAPLTGESQPVSKCIDALAAQTPLAERKNMAYMGTMVTYGMARGIVCGTGIQSELGAISDLVQHAEIPPTPLQVQLSTFAQQLTLGIVVLSFLTFVLGVFVQGQTLEKMFQATIGIAVAAIPEGLPAIVTIALAIGVQRMAGKKALVRRLPSVEVLGAVDVICSDKTGTLTTNSMTARTIVSSEGVYHISGESYRPNGAFQKEHSESPLESGHNSIINQACLVSLLCNDANLVEENDEWILHGDPTEGALLAMAMKHGLSLQETKHIWPRVDELPFETEKRYMATLNHNGDGQRILMVKGAPDRLLNYCNDQFDGQGGVLLDRPYWEAMLHQMASRGMRVLALAEKMIEGGPLSLGHADLEQGLRLIALVGISDPPRSEAITSVEQCRSAGIKVKMITGDNPITAAAIGKELGLRADLVVTGQELDALSSKELSEVANKCDIFARASPANKLALVSALQHNEHVVAMTGDGVNDAPALRQANIGVAMGKKGTDAAKDSSDIVLTDDNFSTIASAVKEGRTVYDNIVKSILFILPTNLAEASVIIFAILAGLTLPITAAQILWVNMITAITLALALVFEAPENKIMMRQPRPIKQPLITGALLSRLLTVGLFSATVVTAIFMYYQHIGASVELARTVAINTLVTLEAVYLVNCRFLTGSIFSRQFLQGCLPSIIAIFSVFFFQACFTYLSFSQEVFGLESLSARDFLLIVIVSMPLLLIVEIEKSVWRNMHSRKNA